MAEPIPVFLATIDARGRLTYEQPMEFGRWLGLLREQRVEVVVRKRRTRRSDAQNRSWWGLVVPAIAEHLGYDRHEYESVHYALVSKCFGVTEKGGVEVPNARSSHLTTAQFCELMEWAVRYAATEWGLVVPLPNEPPDVSQA